MAICPILQNCRCHQKEIQQFYFLKCEALSTFNKSVKLSGLPKHKTNNFQYIWFASLSVLAANYPFSRLTFLATVLISFASWTQLTKYSLILKYQGRTIRGLIGSSVKFTWKFSGDVVSGIEFSWFQEK